NLPSNEKTPSSDDHLAPNHPATEQVKRLPLARAGWEPMKEREALGGGSNTVTERDHHVLGKPADIARARVMLQCLAGRDHQVHTAVALVSAIRKIEWMELSSATVRMKGYDEQAHEQYLATGDSLGKAGAYSIQGQGSELIASIEGDFP